MQSFITVAGNELWSFEVWRQWVSMDSNGDGDGSGNRPYLFSARNLMRNKTTLFFNESADSPQLAS